MPETRREQILSIVQKNQSATVAELAELLQVSEVTVRQDLRRLADEGMLLRTRGGAITTDRANREATFHTRDRFRAEQKRGIGELAAGLVNPRDSIILDASTTSLYVARALLKRQDLHDLTVITNGIYTALELVNRPDITTILTGGILRPTAVSLIGTIVWDTLAKINAMKGFFGAHGISVEQGLTDVNIQEINVKKAMIERCQEVIAVADSSKFGEVGLASYAPIECVKRIITDSCAPSMVEQFRARGVDVMIAQIRAECDDP